ncbi:MAG: MurR/RpiR family transcriptional regulator, partial [Acidimicrobiales bacterium]
MSGPATLAYRIAEAGERLTPSERRLAELVLDDSTAVAFGTVAEVARRVGTSGPTVVRFANKLGFSGYTALRSEVRRSLSEQLKRPLDRIRRPGAADGWAESRRTAVAAVEAVFGTNEADTIERLATSVSCTGGRVWIVASETSSAAAHVLAGGLRLLRPGVRHLTGSRAGIVSDLTDAAAGDVVVAIDFPRYERSVLRTTRLLAEMGATVVAITDGALSPLAELALVWCEVEVPAIGPFDSVLPAVAVVEGLVAEVARLSAARAAERIDRAEALW